MWAVGKIIGNWAGNTGRGRENTLRMTCPWHVKSSKKNTTKKSIQRTAKLGKWLE